MMETLWGQAEVPDTALTAVGRNADGLFRFVDLHAVFGLYPTGAITADNGTLWGLAMYPGMVLQLWAGM
jgi:hypothetical protein